MLLYKPSDLRNEFLGDDHHGLVFQLKGSFVFCDGLVLSLRLVNIAPETS